MMRLAQFLLLLMIAVFSLQSHATQTSDIEWHQWQPSAFELARKNNKLILLDVGTEWCTACNQMQHETYTDQQVQKLLNEHYIAIHVDAEAEPDLGERYGFWGWPALIFIAPDGRHVGFFRGFRPAPLFTQMLTNFNQAHQQDDLQSPQIEVDLISTPSKDEFKQLLDLGKRMLDRFYDEQNHSWGGARMANPYLLKQAWWRGNTKNEADWNQRALATSQQYLKMIDPVWGGIWFGSRAADYSGNYIYERRTEHQAGALSIFAVAYQNDRNPRWLDAIDQVMHYLDDFMLAENGIYFTSQEMHIIADGIDISPAEYFALDDQQRRAIGMPAIDKTQYIDINAKLVIAMADVYQATGDDKWRNRALSLMQKLQSYNDDNGGYAQLVFAQADDSRVRQHSTQDLQRRYLRSQAFAGLASLASFSLSGDSQYLKRAHQVAEVIINQLRDPESGGLYASNRANKGPDGKVLRDQPVVDGGAAVELFNQLSAYTYGAFEDIGTFNAKHYRSYAEAALRAVAQPERLRVQGYFIGQYVLALHQWQNEFTQVSVVCTDTSSIDCKNLHKTALTQLHHPRRIVKLQQPGYYPARGSAALFICNSTLCSSPITADDPELLNKTQSWFKRLALSD